MSRHVGQGGLVTVLMLATAVPPMLTGAISVLSPLIRADLHVSRGEFGLFALVLFLVTAALSIPMGRMSDRVPFAAGLGGVFGFSLLAMITALSAPSLGMLLAAAALGGVSLSIAGPVTNRMVGVLGRPSRHGVLIATKQSGVQIGQVTASLICSLGVGVLSWRLGLGVLAVIVLAILVPSMIWVLSTGRQNVPQTWSSTLPVLVPKPSRPRALIVIMSIYSLLSGIVYQGVIFGLPLFAHESFGLTVAVAGISLVVVAALGFAARLAAGPMIDRSAGVRGPLILVAVVALAGLGLILVAAFTGAEWMLWTGAAIYGLASTTPTVLCSIAIVRFFGAGSVGLLTGIVMLSTFVGFAVGPGLFGYLVDHAGYVTGWAVLTVLTAASCAVPLWLRRDRPASRRPASRRPASRRPAEPASAPQIPEAKGAPSS